MKNYLLNNRIIKHLYFSRELSITALSTTLDRSVPIVLKSLSQLLEEGKVIESGLAPSTGGRRPSVYSVRPDLHYIVTVAMDQFITRVAILDLDNNIVGDIETIGLPLAENENSLELLGEFIESFIIKTGISRNQIVGIGIGMPGFVDVKKGLNYTFLTAGAINICNYLNELTGLPVFIDNDSSVIALAESKFGSGANQNNALVVNLGWGVGLGMILNSNLFRGNNGFAGEFSHIPLFTNNKLCSCGKMGCLETETSLLEITNKAKEGIANGRVSILKDRIFNVDIETAFDLIIQATQRGDQFAIELISKAAYEIGRGIAILIHLLNPESIILSGRGAQAGNIWKGPIQQAIHEFCIPRLAAHTEIEVSQLGYKAELIGAAALVMDHFETISNKHENTLTESFQ